MSRLPSSPEVRRVLSKFRFWPPALLCNSSAECRAK
ncbi:hypothetical protein CBM2586_A10762 [Cupriavidus phytorum]|uniref:Uncharacterized protein n=1 Tax=Cupriavidus taiwanensis TaxID=164546 RepID=A0A975ZW19_9BURK|nr:hypothetical protein CBM2586_A10762 [Cupriavidus taiwanensis]